MENINFGRNRAVSHDHLYNQDYVYNPNNLGPVRILEEAFNTYIQNTAIQSNTIGIVIEYVGNRGEEFEYLYILKRNYPSQGERRFDIQAESEFITRSELDEAENDGVVFNNDRLPQLLNNIGNLYFVYKILLVEIYHNDPESRAFSSPFTIPIRLLYKARLPDEFRRRASTIRGIMEGLLAPNTPPIPTYTTPTVSGGLVEQEFNGSDAVVTSRSFSGICQVCYDSDVREGFCRINCGSGHIFHCGCINDWARSRRTPTCPLCRDPISRMVPIDVPPELRDTSFGKQKIKNSEIKYLMSFI